MIERIGFKIQTGLGRNVMKNIRLLPVLVMMVMIPVLLIISCANPVNTTNTKTGFAPREVGDRWVYLEKGHFYDNSGFPASDDWVDTFKIVVIDNFYSNNINNVVVQTIKVSWDSSYRQVVVFDSSGGKAHDSIKVEKVESKYLDTFIVIGDSMMNVNTTKSQSAFFYKIDFPDSLKDPITFQGKSIELAAIGYGGTDFKGKIYFSGFGLVFFQGGFQAMKFGERYTYTLLEFNGEEISTDEIGMIINQKYP